jgi:DNA-binding Xre family transcriptional regulator
VFVVTPSNKLITPLKAMVCSTVAPDVADANALFVESLTLLMDRLNWDSTELGKRMGVSRQWADNLKKERREGVTLKTMDKFCAALATAEPPLPVVISPADLLDPVELRRKLGVTASVIPSSNAASKKSPLSRESMHAPTVAASLDSLQRERAQLTSTLLDIHTAIGKHLTAGGVKRNDRAQSRVAVGSRKKTGSSRRDRKNGA